MIWFTSDTHFYSEKSIRKYNRPFESVEKLNDEIVRNWNKAVSNEDIIYHLGDFVDYNLRDQEKIERIFDRLNGKKILISGNHDKKLTKCCNWSEIHEYKKIKYQGYTIILFHYPIWAWNKKGKGSIHLHGHSHGKREEFPGYPIFDVGVDCNNYRPISIEEIINEVINNKYQTI